jgi:hypothetical protein
MEMGKSAPERDDHTVVAQESITRPSVTTVERR